LIIGLSEGGRSQANNLSHQIQKDHRPIVFVLNLVVYYEALEVIVRIASQPIRSESVSTCSLQLEGATNVLRTYSPNTDHPKRGRVVGQTVDALATRFANITILKY
jgi:hypothetical protein